MPIFFLLSGSAAALGFKPEKEEKKGNKYLKPLKFWWLKFLRLMVPCIVGTFVVVLPTRYIGRVY